MAPIPKSQEQKGDLGFEAQIFKAADKLRQNVEPSEYKHVVLGLIFLKYVSDAFEARHAQLAADELADPEDPDEYLSENVFWVPTTKAPSRPWATSVSASLQPSC